MHMQVTDTVLCFNLPALLHLGACDIKFFISFLEMQPNFKIIFLYLW